VSLIAIIIFLECDKLAYKKNRYLGVANSVLQGVRPG